MGDVVANWSKALIEGIGLTAKTFNEWISKLQEAAQMMKNCFYTIEPCYSCRGLGKFVTKANGINEQKHEYPCPICKGECILFVKTGNL